MAYQLEYTDTFGGELNYSWARRAYIPETTDMLFYGPTEKAKRLWLVRKAKAWAGITGVNCDTHHNGDMIELRPRKHNTVLFITWIDDEHATGDNILKAELTEST